MNFISAEDSVLVGKRELCFNQRTSKNSVSVQPGVARDSGSADEQIRTSNCANTNFISVEEQPCGKYLVLVCIVDEE
jgi:hypothetical protein